MIIILGHYPTRENEQDGMIQRIAAIDSMLADYKRVYISRIKTARSESFISRLAKSPKRILERKFLRKKNAVIYKWINHHDFEHFLKNADLIYIHSIHFAKLVPDDLLAEFGHKIIIDLHGCVVEELEFYQTDEKILAEFSKTECAVFKYVANFVSVSNNMTDFYRAKYINTQARFIKLPIFNTEGAIAHSKPFSDKPVILYAGGAQKWQNVDIMINTMKRTIDSYHYMILTPDVDFFKTRMESLHFFKKITIKSIPKNKMADYYKNAHFGMVLRDENTINTVSCPTKLIEYMGYGLIPVVLQPKIGDFDKSGYRYILNKDLISGLIPSPDELDQMRLHNYTVLKSFNDENNLGKKSLMSLIAQFQKATA